MRRFGAIQWSDSRLIERGLGGLRDIGATRSWRQWLMRWWCSRTVVLRAPGTWLTLLSPLACLSRWCASEAWLLVQWAITLPGSLLCHRWSLCSIVADFTASTSLLQAVLASVHQPTPFCQVMREK
ncbi:MAG: hypothetical protein ACFCU9_01390 [Cyanophyceae cyanobacterium]